MVAVVVDLGGSPKITPQNPDKAKRIYSEWTTTKKAAEERINWAFPETSKLNPNHSLSAYDYMQLTRKKRLIQEIERAENLKSRYSRLKAIEKVQAKITEILKSRNKPENKSTF